MREMNSDPPGISATDLNARTAIRHLRQSGRLRDHCRAMACTKTFALIRVLCRAHALLSVDGGPLEQTAVVSGHPRERIKADEEWDTLLS